MGSRLATAAFTFVSAYNERARQSEQREIDATGVALLALMGLRAIDDSTEPTYFAGWEATAAALGLPATETSRKRVQRATAALIEASAIDRLTRGHKGSTARYRLSYAKGTPVSPFEEESGTPVSPIESDSGTPQTDSGTNETVQRDSHVPPRRYRNKEDEAARAEPSNLTLMPFTLATPEAPAWDDHLPEPRNSTEAARCRRHPTGTSERCGACGENRQAWVDANRKAERSRKPAPLRYRTAGGRRICDNQPHQPLADGTCANCEIHADDLADLLIGAHA